MGIACLILAVISIILAIIFPYISVIIGIVGIVLGIVEINRRKKIGVKKVLPIVGTVISSVGIALSMFMLFYLVTPKVGSIYGKWYSPNKDMYLEIDKDGNFELYTSDKKTSVIKASYTMEKDTTDQKYVEYVLTVSAKERIVNGESLTSPYTTKFSLILEDNGTSMGMMNWVSYNLYEFIRVK